MQKWAKDLSRHFSKEDIHISNKHMERCTKSVIIRKIQMKTTARHHFTPIRIAMVFKKEISIGEDVDKLGPYELLVGM